MDKLREWIDLRGLTIEGVTYVKQFVRLRLSDGSFVDIGSDDAFDEAGMRLRNAGELPADELPC